MGGNTKNPSYEEVCSNSTGHAEVVQIKYNLEDVTYKDLLEIFWKIHDPTQKNRQGPDIGTQYRSVIFYHNEKQKQIALESRYEKNKSNEFEKDIVTEIKPAEIFYKAEEYHQKYFEKNKNFSCNIFHK